jgi:hypothetical protein
LASAIARVISAQNLLHSQSGLQRVTVRQRIQIARGFYDQRDFT